MLPILLIPGVLLLLCVFFHVKWKQSFWKRKGLDYIEPEFLFGNVRQLITTNISFGEQYQKFYKEFKSKNLKHGGVYLFTVPVYIPLDLELIKNILQNDFSNFTNRGLLQVYEDVDPLLENLFNMKDDNWRTIRRKIAPAFSTGKIKLLFETINNGCANLLEVLHNQSQFPNPLDIKDIMSRYTVDIIVSYIFGIECNSLQKRNEDFREYGRQIFELPLFKQIQVQFFNILPRVVVKAFRLKQVPQEVENFVFDMVKKVITYRKTENIRRNDLLQQLLDNKNARTINDNKRDSSMKSIDHSLPLTEIAAQCHVFFIAGYETSATTLTFALLELALDQGVQSALRDEINRVLDKHNGNMSYDAVTEIRYLDNVIYETLRLHPPLGVLPRICGKPYQIPGTSLILETGTKVFIPIQAIHRDPDIYPDPDKFDPERFSPENKANRHPLAFLAFGEGPRICIGAKLGMLEMKLALLTTVKNFQITVNKKMKMPIKYITNWLIEGVDGGVWLDLKKI